MPTRAFHDLQNALTRMDNRRAKGLGPPAQDRIFLPSPQTTREHAVWKRFLVEPNEPEVWREWLAPYRLAAWRTTHGQAP